MSVGIGVLPNQKKERIIRQYPSAIGNLGLTLSDKNPPIYEKKRTGTDEKAVIIPV